ncbi:MAG: cation diffusion facilitator family transporter [Chitinivibrionales bacterium]|nr:cation diffusion facilitator family transporter [Chitinivibrionales bacterium]
MQADKLKYLVAVLSVFSNLALVLLKIVIGFAMGSISVLSEAAHSAIDVLAAMVAVVGVQQAGLPADRDHPYGHGKFESVSGFIQALLVFLAAAWIVYQGLEKLLHPRPLQSLAVGVAVMLVSAIVNLVMGLALLRVARKDGSVALKADAWHCLTDVNTSAGVMLALGALWLAAQWFPAVNVAWIDPVAAIAVAGLIVKAAWNLAAESLRDLLDVSLPKKEEEAIVGVLRARYPRILGFHNLRTRRSGAARFIEFHIVVDPEMSVKRSHQLDHAVAAELKEKFTNAQVMVHIEPANATNLKDRFATQ